MSLHDALAQEKARMGEMREVEFLGTKIKVKPLTLAEFSELRGEMESKRKQEGNLAFAKRLIKMCVPEITDEDMATLNECSMAAFKNLQEIVLDISGLREFNTPPEAQEKN